MDLTVHGNSRPALWLVTDQLPYPPRNGITLPIYNYLLLLRQTFEVKLILLIKAEQSPSTNELASNERLYGNIHRIAFSRKPKWNRVVGEITGREMFQHGWTAEKGLAKDSINASDPVAIIVSPMSAVAMWRACGGSTHYGAIPMGAAINDCTTAEYHLRIQSQISNLTTIAKGLIDKIRARRIGKIEGALLTPYRAIFLQTERDQKLMSELVSPKIAKKVTLAPNGVNANYIHITRQASNTLLFIGEMSGEYGSIVEWLVSEVWPHIMTTTEDIRLLLVGRGANAALKAKFAATPRLEHLEYVEDLRDVYAKTMVAISPVFKGFGLINKTIEAMACGIPVVGGMAAFNGIPGFVPGVHGAVVHRRSTTDFVSAIKAMVQDPHQRECIGRAGRTLIANGFVWRETVDRIAQSLLRPSLYVDGERQQGNV